MLLRQNLRFFSASTNLILRESRDKVALLTLNRPKSLNALNDALITELNSHLEEIDRDDIHSAIVLTGSGQKAFAAGADIKEMKEKEYPFTFTHSMLGHWKDISSRRKPIIAAVNGYALGGGFELALLCDIIYASENAQFGLPEIKLGTIPGCGGTQRLIREIGKSKAMEMTLTGKFIKADEAERRGIVSQVLPQAELVEQAVKIGNEIGKYSRPIVSLAKDAINKGYELGLREGLDYEHRVFWSTFATEDQKEGMRAYDEKREAEFKNR